MRLFQGALDTPLDSPFSATLSVHGLHFTVCASLIPEMITSTGAKFSWHFCPAGNSLAQRGQVTGFDGPWGISVKFPNPKYKAKNMNKISAARLSSLLCFDAFGPYLPRFLFIFLPCVCVCVCVCAGGRGRSHFSGWGTSQWSQPLRFSQKCCNTNGRRIATQTGAYCDTNGRSPGQLQRAKRAPDTGPPKNKKNGVPRERLKHLQATSEPPPNYIRTTS